jgi:hypothetical protein
VNFLRIIKRAPHLPRHAAKCRFESLVIVLARVFHLCHIRHFSDIHRFHPAGEFPANVPVCLRVALAAVADANQLTPWQPAVNLFHPFPLVCLRAPRQGDKEPAEVHPGGFAQEDGAGGIIRMDEVVQERVQVVGRGGEVEPCRIEDLDDVSIESWHGGDRSGCIDKGGAENSHWRGGHGYFDGVVNVYGMNY